MEKKQISKTESKLFTESQTKDINLLLGELEKFFSKELVKIKKASPFIITPVQDGFDLGFYRVKKVNDTFIVSTIAGDILAEFLVVSHATLYCCLLVKKVFRLADELSDLHKSYIETKNEFNVRDNKRKNLKPKTKDDWWKYDLYSNKTNEAKLKFMDSKAKLIEFSKHNHMLKKLKMSQSID
jgi:hypothetical protein